MKTLSGCANSLCDREVLPAKPGSSEKVIMTSDNIAEYVGENNQFTEKPVTEYPGDTG